MTAAGNPIETTLLTHIDRPDVLFVFPTDIAMNLWADRLLALRGGGSIVMEKFTAWDKFKQESVSAQKQDKKCVPSILRKIFVSSLIQKNREQEKAGNEPLFKFLIPPEFAYTGSAFVSWFTAILPQLGSWFEKTTGLPISQINEASGAHAGFALEGDDKDLFTLASAYQTFLDTHGLFEPAWEKPPFKDTGKQCFIFFPETLTDFSEYRELLESAAHVEIVKSIENTTSAPQTFFYTNSRSEITEAALFIRALYENKTNSVPFEEIVVSIPDTENYEPYVSREFKIRNIPFVSREGKALSSYAGGKLFGDIGNCNSRNFSFDSVSNLLLNRRLPWKDSEAISQLIDFGIKNNCIASWQEDGENIDVWEDALAAPAGSREERAREFYRTLKAAITKICNAKKFEDLRQYYFSFRESFFNPDREACPPETDLILSRCISELLVLIEIEKSYPDIPVPDPYTFFTERLDETLYLPQQLSSGVTILPYRTAAQVPFEYHIVIGASQDNLSAVFGSLTFLLADKRKKLGIEDTDASEAFIKLHTLNSRNQAVFFCAEETFSGYAIPHSFLDAPGAPVKRYGELDEYKILFSEDHFLKEQELYSDLQAGKKISDSSQIFYRQQIDGFNAWRKRRSHAESPEGGPDSLIMELIKNRYCRSKTMPGKLSVSASALKPYYQCALQWLFREILALEKVRMETTLMADNVVGSLYHAALDHFFKKAKEKNGGMILPPENGLLPDEYAALVTESVDAALSQFSTGNEQFKISALTARLIRAEKQSIFDQLVIFLTAILSYFAGYYIADTELKLSHAPLEKPYFLTGIVDCVLEDRSDVSNPKSVILDFKLYGTPNHGLCTGDGDNGLEDFQLPMYVRLTEENGYKTVSTALFFSILKAEPNVIFGVISSNGKEKPYFKKDRIERTGEADNKFDAVMAEFNEKTERYAKEVLAGAFSTISDDEEKCFACDYHAVCRTTYAVNRRSHG